MEFVNPEGLRQDGRRPHEMRQMHTELGVVENADGSAVFEMGNTKVMAVVYGPHEVQNRSQQLHDRALVQCEFSMATFSTGERRRRGKTDRLSTELSLIIRQTMEASIMTHLLPRSQIDIYVQVLQADGGTKAACINAASMALAHAGIPMQNLVVSCGAGYLNTTPLLDLNNLEDNGGGPALVVGYFPKHDKLSLLQMDAKLPIERVEEILHLATQGAKAVSEFMLKELMENTETVASAIGHFKM